MSTWQTLLREDSTSCIVGVVRQWSLDDDSEEEDEGDEVRCVVWLFD